MIDNASNKLNLGHGVKKQKISTKSYLFTY
jgi:hypothetical protein